MLNRCEFIGNLGRDPEVKSFQNGGRVCSLNLAVTEKWKSRDGERKERTEWVSVQIFIDGLVGIAERYLRKGSRIYVAGKMQTRKWQDREGQNRYSTEIVLQGFDAQLVLLDGKRDRDDDPGAAHEPASSDPFGTELDDEIPF